MRRRQTASKSNIPDDPEVDTEEIMEEARSIAEAERNLSVQQSAADLTTDIQSVYGRRGYSVFRGFR